MNVFVLMSRRCACSVYQFYWDISSKYPNKTDINPKKYPIKLEIQVVNHEPTY